jgi:2-polyprenyl-3-methyl-5-hydroxy-6-metoxy-1,4-benzoquinol methylase
VFKVDNRPVQTSNGRFFLYVPIDDKVAAKILIRRSRERYLQRVIDVHTLLHLFGYALDLDETIRWYDDGQYKYPYYLVEIAQNMQDVRPPKDWLMKLEDFCSANNIWRRNFFTECSKGTVLTNGEFRLIDIDPQFKVLQSGSNSEAQFKIRKPTLDEELIKHGSFPYRKRSYPYQGINGLKGSRDMEHRYQVMQLPLHMEGSVLDLGCSLGAVMIECCNRGCTSCVGIDSQEETISAAKKYISTLNCAKGIELIHADLSKIGKTPTAGNDYVLPGSIYDTVFALSIIKHAGNNIYNLINTYTGKVCYFEFHPHAKNCLKELETNLTGFKEIRFLGYTTDRGKRANYKITR